MLNLYFMLGLPCEFFSTRFFFALMRWPPNDIASDFRPFRQRKKNSPYSLGPFLYFSKKITQSKEKIVVEFSFLLAQNVSSHSTRTTIHFLGLFAFTLARIFFRLLFLFFYHPSPPTLTRRRRPVSHFSLLFSLTFTCYLLHLPTFNPFFHLF